MAAAHAFQAEVCAHTEDFPLLAPARVLFFQFDDVSYLIATAGENGMYWGVTGDYDYYERLD